MKSKTNSFSSTLEALDFIDALSKDKIKGLLNSSLAKTGEYTWFVTYTPKSGKKK
jgi:hypothetical protein